MFTGVYTFISKGGSEESKREIDGDSLKRNVWGNWLKSKEAMPGVSAESGQKVVRKWSVGRV